MFSMTADDSITFYNGKHKDPCTALLSGNGVDARAACISGGKHMNPATMSVDKTVVHAHGQPLSWSILCTPT